MLEENVFQAYLDREYTALGHDIKNLPDGPDLWLYNSLKEMLEVFGNQGFSGSSAGMAVSMFGRLAMFEPLSPLTGEDDEWNKIGPDEYQNKRCSSIFKKFGSAYNIEGIIFRDKDGHTYINSDSRVYVTFPCMPESVIQDRPS
jgi:hypothetical protein